MSQTKVDDSRAEILSGADLHDVRTKSLEPETVEISSAEEEERASDSGSGSTGESGQAQDTGSPEGSAAEVDDAEEQALVKGHSSPSDPDANDDSGEPTFGELVSASAADPIDVEGPFDEPDMPPHRRLTSQNLQALPFANATSLGTVLAQALQTNDLDLLDTCLAVQDLSTIRATIERLDSPLATTLLQKLAERLHRRPGRAGSLLVWIQWTIVAHGGYLATQSELMRKMSALHRVLRQRSNGLQPLLSLKGKLDMLEAQLEIRRRLQTSTRAAHEVEADDERVIYVEDQDDDSQNDEEQATSASSRRKRRTTLSGTRQPSNGLGSLADGEESSEAMPTTMNGDMGSSEAGNDESESDSNDLMDDEAEETDDDSADERDDSVDHDDVSTEDDENEDDESELAMPPAKRFAGMSKTSNAPQQWR